MSRTCQELGVCQRRTPACHGCEVHDCLNDCGPQGTFQQQAPRRTCAELGVCQHRAPACGGCRPAPAKPAKPVSPAEPRTVWSFKAWDLVPAVAIVAAAYFAAGYFG